MKTVPYAHQLKDFERTKDLKIFAVWWEQGTGKSKLIVDTACHLYERGELTGLLIIAPNGVHGNFVYQEMPVHAWDTVRWTGYVYDTGRSSTKRGQKAVDGVCTVVRGEMKVMAISYDAIRTHKGFDAAKKFLTQHEAMVVCDESTAIAEPSTIRSKETLKLGPLAKYRRVMSGTPVAEGPFKIFNQMRFLDPEYWRRHGLTSYMVFKTSFAVFQQQTRRSDGQQYQQLLHYQNLDYLQKLIAEHSSRVLKEDVLDLPPKVYTRVVFELDTHQRKVYDDLVQTLTAVVDESHDVEALTALVQLTRLQQITCGYVGVEEMPEPAEGDTVVWRHQDFELAGDIRRIDELGYYEVVGVRTSVDPVSPGARRVDGVDWLEIVRADDPQLFRLVNTNQKIVDLFQMPRDNPRIEALLAVLEPITTKVIIWARYRRDVDLIMDQLKERAVRYDGQVTTHDREEALRRFREDDTIRYFVANPATISMGVTLTQAKTVIYYSNTFQLEKRLQSEDRAHRIGQTSSVNVIDLVARDTVDEKIVTALRKKFSIAAEVSGDRLREWIQ